MFCLFSFLDSFLIHLLRLGNANSVLLQVVNGVPFAKESITKNGEWASWLWNIHTHESRNAGALDLKNVIKWTDGEVMASEGEGEIWQAVALVALHGVLAVK